MKQNGIHMALKEGNIFEERFSSSTSQKSNLHKKLSSADLTNI